MEPKYATPFTAVRDGQRLFIMKPHTGPVPPDAGTGEAFAAGQVAGTGPDRLFVGFGAKGVHAFSAQDGAWLEGPSLEYADYIVLPLPPDTAIGRLDDRLKSAGESARNGLSMAVAGRVY